MARSSGPQPSLSQSIRVYATPKNALPQDPHGRVWEDLLQDEKIEKLMHVVTVLWNRCERLERENNDLRNHRHSVEGYPMIQRGIGEEHIAMDSPEQSTRNPFNSKAMAEERDSY